MFPIFYRNNFTQLWLQLISSETLGILDTDYIEDEEGNDSKLTLVHIASGMRWTLNMLPTQDPPPHSTFQTVIILSSIPNGLFEVRGRVRDVVGNYTILNSIHFGGAGTSEPLGFIVDSGAGWSIHLPGLSLIGGYVLPAATAPLAQLPSLSNNISSLSALTINNNRVLAATTMPPNSLPAVEVKEGIYG